MSCIQVTLNTKNRFELGNVTGKDALRKLSNLINAALSGVGPDISDWQIAVRPENLGTFSTSPQELATLSRASKFFQFTSATGDPTLDVDPGATATITATSTDADDAAAFVETWNTQTGSGGYAGVATNLTAAITLNGMTAGQTVRVGPYVFTAVDGTSWDGTPFTFPIGGSNTQDAAALAFAINSAPGMLSSIRAESVSANVFMCIYDGSAASAFFISTPNSGTVSIVRQFTLASGVVAIVSTVPGAIGNSQVWSTSGTYTGFDPISGPAVSGGLQGGTGGVSETIIARNSGEKDRITSQTTRY